MIRKHSLTSSLLLGLGLGLGLGAATPAAGQCTGAVPPPSCVEVDDSGDVHPDYRVTNRCPHPITLYFDVMESGDDWVLDRTNFTAIYGYLNVQPDETGASGIRYDAEAAISCCPNIRGVSCSGEPSEETPS